MSSPDIDKVFAGSIPKLYEEHLVPLIFEAYAAEVAKRLSSRKLSRVLEIAAGTGVVTRAMASALPESVTLIATDLNQAMLDHAASVGTPRPVEWRQADAMELPFPDASFDAVVCQFGVMFFPDKVKAFSEARRVLVDGGVFIFNVWDRISENEFSEIIEASMTTAFPDDPPVFLSRTPYGYHDRRVIESDLARAGFGKTVQFDTVTERARAESAHMPAMAFCQGTPLRSEIEARDASRLVEATEIAGEAIAKRFGRGHVDAKIQAHVITVER